MASTPINSITVYKDEVSSLSQPIRLEMAAQFGLNNSVLSRLMDKAETYSGVGQIQVAFNGALGTMRVLNGYNDATPTHQNDATAVYINDCKLETDISYSIESLIDNGQDPNKLANLVDMKHRIAKETLSTMLQAFLFHDGSTATATFTHPILGPITVSMNGKQFYGIPYYLTSALTGTVHGINRATTGNEYIKHHLFDTATTIGSSGTLARTDIDTDLMTCANGDPDQQPDLAITTPAIYAYLKDIFGNAAYNPRRIAQEQKDMYIAGAKGGIMYENCEFIYSPYATTGSIYYINTENIKLMKSNVGIYEGTVFETSGPAAFAQRLVMPMQLVATRLNNCGRRISIT